MEDYAGRILADRYRLPLPPSDEYELIETRAFDTRSGQEVLVRQVPLPEVVDAELLDGRGAGPAVAGRGPVGELPAVRRAIAAAQAAASVPDHPRLDQVFDVFAEGGSLWIVSELVPARPLAALIADEPLNPYRAAEVAADVLTALRVLHAHGWTHRNITVRTVLICDDGRVVLTGLAAGAAEEALCGYDPVPPPDGSTTDPESDSRWGAPAAPAADPSWGTPPPGLPVRSATPAHPADDPGTGAPGGEGGSDSAGGAAGYAPLVAPGYDTGPRYSDHITPGRPPEQSDAKAAARAGAIAAYRAGAQAAAARKAEARPEGSNLPEGYAYPYGGPEANAAAPWPGVTRRDQPLPEQEQEQEPEAPTRPALPAQLALPQGYRQAETAEQPCADAPEDDWAGPRAGAGAYPAGAAVAPGRGYGGDGGPRSGLDAERARQTRMAVVGAVTERWAPEQARSVQGPWQLAAPVGPATDLWALGALLYRAVQGHAPYPEDSAAELVEMVCAEAPAFAEECGPLRPVVESLLRQDPTERPDFEELRGWLRSLVRSAPEPDGGFGALPMPEPDPAKLPVVRRRGDLHGRHRNPAAPRRSRSLGRTLLVGVLALLAAAVAYAMVFMPRSGETGQSPQNAGKPVPQQSQPRSPEPTKPQPQPQQSSGAPQSKPAQQTAPEGYTIQQDPEHFEIATPNGWERHGINEAGQVRYTEGAFTLIVVPGRDKVQGNPDPATYQKDKEPELNAYRNSTWTTSGDIKSTTVGQQLRVTGRYTWHDANGRSVFARNFVVALGNGYHVVMVTGPEDEQDKVTEVFEKATGSYKSGG
ncbi:serine/threonine protein kinase [Streptomyces sp. NBC_01565]|uniref:serine/threonine protein kinase n=1 Tax=Streptomyces sp. NBC_01565 TaxID=2975881 RepID=UPI002258D23D|nr:serine/threonine protein kinase [Streptomyces sp. NBC_01565]MCX4541797.1 serine/threonine protein kinase [Streptomyces sp. NBC_01565]